MRLRTRFFIFIIVIHAIMIMMAAFLLKYNVTLFVISEALLVVSIFISIGLYQSFVKPLNIMTSGLESLKEKDFSIKFVKIGQYEIDQLIEVYNKMIDQLREERIEVNEQNYFLEKLIQASPSGIIILDFENKIQAVNPSVLQNLNINSNALLGRKFEEINHPITQQLALYSSRGTVVLNGSGGKSFKCHKAQFVHKGFPQHFIIVEELTAEILQAEKNAYEKVIRMMSHEINNTVGAVNSMLGTINYEKFNEDEEYGQVLQVCIDRNKRMAKFMSNFAEVIKLPEVKKENSDLNALLKDIATLFSDTCRTKNINLKFESDRNNFPLYFDPSQLEQALINIIKNAIESIGQNGQITIIASQVQNNLIIRDTGKGIDLQSKLKLFSPFFSTKKDGQGIGLTLIKEILYKHKFQFSLETKQEGYTEFKIDFV